MSIASSHSERIISMRTEDLSLRQRLIEQGTLFEGYHPAMEEMHIKNARELAQIVREIGWATVSRVGAEARDAAMVIAQHAISVPDLQQEFLSAIEAAVLERTEEPRNQAFLHDRICFNKGIPQRYGTQYDWDEHGLMSPWHIEDPDQVDERRKEVGLNPIAEETQAIRTGVLETRETPPADREQRQRDIRAWRVRTGWVVPS